MAKLRQALKTAVNGNFQKWALRVLIVAVMAWFGNKLMVIEAHVQDIRIEVREIQSNRFTDQDWAKEYRSLDDRLDELVTTLPPQWVRNALDDLRERVENLEGEH